jgi:hypothetical protein
LKKAEKPEKAFVFFLICVSKIVDHPDLFSPFPVTAKTGKNRKPH